MFEPPHSCLPASNSTNQEKPQPAETPHNRPGGRQRAMVEDGWDVGLAPRLVGTGVDVGSTVACATMGLLRRGRIKYYTHLQVPSSHHFMPLINNNRLYLQYQPAYASCTFGQKSPLS
jgi:hypothetical protein